MSSSAAPINHIFLDMDGVLSDFISAVLVLHQREDVYSIWPAGERDLFQVLGISKGEFWKRIDDQGLAFWARLEPYPWFEELIRLVSDTAPFTILTSPSLSPACLAGKVEWLYQHFPKQEGGKFRNFLIGDAKHLLAAPGRVLIDDTESKVLAFREAGGEAILFPQHWNRNYGYSDRLAYVAQRLRELS